MSAKIETSFELPKYFEENYSLPPWRQHDVVYAMSILEERGDLLVGEAGYATTQRLARPFSTSISMKAVTSASASSDWVSYFDRIRLTIAGAS